MRIDKTITVPLEEVLVGIDNLNDYVQREIMGDSQHLLEDISYQVIGGNSSGKEYIGGDIYLRVQAEVVIESCEPEESSPLPWSVGSEGDPVVIGDANDNFVAMTLPVESGGATENDYERAKFICKAANNHFKLFDALQSSK